MVRFPPLESLGEIDFTVLCSVLEGGRGRLSGFRCSRILGAARVEDEGATLTFTSRGGLTVGRVNGVEEAVEYAARGFRLMMVSSKCRLCGKPVFTCILGVCGECLSGVVEGGGWFRSWVHRYASLIEDVYATLSRGEGLTGVDRMVSGSLSEGFRLLWDSTCELDLYRGLLSLSLGLLLTCTVARVGGWRRGFRDRVLTVLAGWVDGGGAALGFKGLRRLLAELYSLAG